MRINKSKPKQRSFAQRYPTGRALLPLLLEQDACDEAVEWVKKRQGRSLEWLWFNCPDWEWVYWLADWILTDQSPKIGDDAAANFQRVCFPVPEDPVGSHYVRATLARLYPPTRPRN